jgi:hypothetical protein
MEHLKVLKSITSFFLNKPTTRFAEALLHKNTVYVRSFSKTDVGVWISQGKISSCKFSEAELLTVLIRKALSESIVDIPHPSSQAEWKRIEQLLLDATSEKNLEKLNSNANYIQIFQNGSDVEITPVNSLTENSTDGARKTKINDPFIGQVIVKCFEQM